MSTKVGRNDPCPCGKGKKYKKCCQEKDEKNTELTRRVMNVTRRDFISGPYKDCPNQQCISKGSFGVFTSISGSETYARECIKCGYQKNFNLPKIQKRIIYLDQFIISNLIKLLDKEHPSHQRIKSDPFWEALFIKLERALKSQAITCPDSFYHRDESITGGIDFKLMKRLYEHFSNSATLYPSGLIEKSQISHHFDGWIIGKKVIFDFNPENIVFGNDLHSWSNGIGISVGHTPRADEIENLKKNNTMTRERFKYVWSKWQNEKGIKFVRRMKDEISSLGRDILNTVRQFELRRVAAMAKVASDEKYELQQEDFLPPLSSDILEELIRITRKNGVRDDKIMEVIINYFNDLDSLLEIPQIKISSAMFAGLAHQAANGKKDPPKSTTDIQFISSYLPYCDALFVDKESALLLKEFPKETPLKFRLREFNARVFSLSNKGDFLDYLDQLVADIPKEQMAILRDMEGEDYGKPYWSILEHEKLSSK